MEINTPFFFNIFWGLRIENTMNSRLRHVLSMKHCLKEKRGAI